MASPVADDENDPLVPVNEIMSADAPTEAELAASERLVEFLRDNGDFESEERQAERALALEELQVVVDEFIMKVCTKLNRPTEIDGQPPQAQLFPFGSYRLGVCSPGSDIDTLCLVPGYVTIGHFFFILHGLLLAHEKVKNLTKIETAYVPIMTMAFGTVDIDISFAAVPDLQTIPKDIDLVSSNILNKLKDKAVASINGARTNEILLRLVPNLESFRIALRVVRIWSKARGIYGNVYGYMGGVNCALMCAFACQRYPTAAPAVLLMRMFQGIAEWQWPTPLFVNNPGFGELTFWDKDKSEDVMPVITPAYPMINSMRSASKTTRQRMVDEFKRGFKLSSKIIRKGKKWGTLVTPPEFFTKYQTFVHFKVIADNEKNFSTWSMTVESKLARLAGDLEMVQGIASAIPYPKCFESDTEKFRGSFFIALVTEKTDSEHKEAPAISGEVRRFLRKLNEIPYKEAPWLVQPEILTRKKLPLFVFPGGVRPEPKKPKGKKVRKE